MSMRVRIVCPEHDAYDGEAVFVSLPSTDGMLGVAPHHASEICTTEAGYVRICDTKMGSIDHTIAVGVGYAQITSEQLVILAERAEDLAKVDREKLQSDIQGFEDKLRNLSQDDAHRSYLYNEIAWCKLLLAQ
ncbi:MAG: ATP synthase F1 subunit epsilon [Collinsella sp.]|nr:ATP synthase F1 subunit epsilon [Collinsella sp.]